MWPVVSCIPNDSLLLLFRDLVCNNLQDRGDCQTSRKLYKTSHSVGWSVGWKIGQSDRLPSAGGYIELHFGRGRDFISSHALGFDSGLPASGFTISILEQLVPQLVLIDRSLAKSVDRWRRRSLSYCFKLPESGALHLCSWRFDDSFRRQEIRHLKARDANPVLGHPVIDIEAVR